MKNRNMWIKNPFRASSPGFTLIELIAVIIIIGIVSHVAVVNVSNVVEKTRLKNAANVALADLRYAQEMAMNKRRQVRFVVQAGSNRYYAIYTDDNSAVPNSDGQPIDRTLNTGDFKDVTIHSSETNNSLTFSDIGRPSVGGGYFDYRSVMSLNSGEYEIYIFGSGLSVLDDGGSSGCGC